ncbi:hypothetical protein BDY19DRAFT_898077, partial [Irpex rosettiformis]
MIRHTLLPYKTPANEFFSPDLFPKTFPTLFPYGVGGLEDKSRKSSLGLRVHVRHLLRLADRRFQTHKSFLFVAFNMLQRREVLWRSSMKVRSSAFHSVAEQFALISPDTLKRLCERMQDDPFHGEHSPADEDERRAFRLLKEVNLVNAAVPGSAASKMNMRNELRALMIEHGIPSFYVTLNPADVHSPIVRFFNNDQNDIDDLSESLASDAFAQCIRIADNPFAPAKFFDTYMTAFIQ